MREAIVTTSWDDGHVLDLKLAELLKRYNIRGTFYISPKNREIPSNHRLTDNQIVELSKDFEIGAHTMTHPRLTALTDEVAKKEIEDSKVYLENVTGKSIISFCYPSGYYAKRHEIMVKEAGFKLGRTVNRFVTEFGSDPIALPTTNHAYRHWSDVLPIFHNAGPRNFLKQYLNWDKLAISFFDKAKGKGGVFHLWGHSWEVEKNNDWDRLERVLKHISNHVNVEYLTNGETI